MHRDLFGIVGRDDVLRSTQLLAGLRGMTGCRTPARPASPDAAGALDLFDACRRLAEQGAQALLLPSPCHQHLLPLLIDEVGVPVIGLDAVTPSHGNAGRASHGTLPTGDRHRLMVDRALTMARAGGDPRPMFRLGVVGGVGPAATVDFLSKLVRSTPAECDQDHIKVLLEQNPQIPDRTAFLLHRGADPTIALYATCKRLERQGASAIAIPCNTAHAFLPPIAPRLRIPIVDMIGETLDHIVERHGSAVHVGLLATTGTVASGVYAAAAQARGLALRVPSTAGQLQVMDAIYGPLGIKAGHTQGACETALRAASKELVLQGAQVLILGCTELPLVFRGATLDLDGTCVALVDPSDILARRCIALATPTHPQAVLR
jgi:aspartate racemase